MSQQQFIPTPKFEEYKERFKDFYKMQRRADGVILVEAHTNGGPIQLSVENHRSVGQMLKTVGADPENEIMIFTGSGDEFMMDADPEGFKLEAEDLPYWAYEYAYKDGRINVSSMVNDLEIPTIGVINGPGFHTEMLLMCDITICSEDAITAAGSRDGGRGRSLPHPIYYLPGPLADRRGRSSRISAPFILVCTTLGPLAFARRLRCGTRARGGLGRTPTSHLSLLSCRPKPLSQPRAKTWLAFDIALAPPFGGRSSCFRIGEFSLCRSL